MTPDASIVIPVKGFATGKSRLAKVLSPEERDALNRRLAVHVLKAALELEAYVTVYILSPDETIAEFAQSYSAHFLHQTTFGLNAGLSEAAVHLPAHRTIFLAADLPNLRSDDIEPLLQATGIGLAPDHSQTGTNALSVPEPDALPFSFGPHSMRLHHAAAKNLQLSVQLIQRPGLAIDLDTREDLERIKGWP